MSFTIEQQKIFLLWVTGSTRLPIGGFQNLPKKITVLNKTPSIDIDPDNDVPSVSVCFRQCKFPNYSTEEIMRERLLFSMGNGSGKYLLN